MPDSVPLVRIFRGHTLESLHRGSLALVEGDRPILLLGDAARPVFYRSTLKPIQALPLIVSGAADGYGLTPVEIALASGSHSGAESHVTTARSILRKAGVPEDALRCGGHWSGDLETACEQRKTSERPVAVFSNCSGKHSGMLAAAKWMGAPLEGYLDLTHPLQQSVLRLLSHLTGLPAPSIQVAIDGCGAPTFAVPLVAMARSFSRLANPAGVPANEAAAIRRVTTAMAEHPEMVGGENRFDTDLMRAAKGRLFAKAGAEGVHATAIPGRGLGLAVKCEDGSDRGYRIVVLEILRHLGVLSDAEAEKLLERHATPVLRNFAGTEVGRVESGLTDADLETLRR